MCWAEFLRLKLDFRVFNVSINICCCYAGFNTFVVFYYTCCISVLTDSPLDSRPLTFAFQPQAHWYLEIGCLYLHGSSWYSNFCRVQVMTRTIDSSVAYFLKLQSSLLSLPIREFKKLRLLLQPKRHFKIKLCFRLTVSLLFLFYHVVQNRRGTLSLAWHEWFPLKKDLLLRVGVVARASNREFKIYDTTAATTPQILHI